MQRNGEKKTTSMLIPLLQGLVLKKKDKILEMKKMAITTKMVIRFFCQDFVPPNFNQLEKGH